jgi:predicted nucleotide-binding protein (sugar kinase/HSP70/actin superfamily)/activator of 2-hydroxyglutaryl-CoA dehydratase
MREAWQHNIPLVWEEREYPLPEGVDPKSLIKVPENAQYFAALGAVEFGKEEDAVVGVYQGTRHLERYIQEGRKASRQGSDHGLSRSAEELELFREQYRPVPFEPARFKAGDRVEAYIGVDGGSTSTKAVLLSPKKEVLCQSYQLSRGNPIEDTVEVIADLRHQVESQGAALHILGVGTTGYAKDVLKDVLGADAAIVETVAHAESALHYYENVDVICDVGGQDIKIMALKDGSVKDFKLNTQCSAGNGYFLQSTAGGFGVPVEEFADAAFGAEAMPNFGYGCAVFMQSDIVDFQRQGWSPAEIMAGLANVLPKNIWLYVAQIPNLAKLGKRFVLQGGTQRNLAAVKAQVDFIRSRYRGQGVEPEIIVHRFCGESGAIGAALEAARLSANGRKTSFIGLEATQRVSYTTTTSELTRCHFCKNECLRTFIDVDVGYHEHHQGDVDTELSAHGSHESNVPLAEGARRLIVGNSCEKGLVEDVDAMRVIKKELDSALGASPNLLVKGAKDVFKPAKPAVVADPSPRVRFTPEQKRRAERVEKRGGLRIGIPRVLNAYSTNPLFSAYFESLGVPARNIVYSDFTSEELYKEGAKRGSIDPCFPSKVALAHVHNLIYKKHEKRPLDIVFFPMLDDLRSELVNTQACRACPTVTATPESVKAAFTKEGDIFADKGIAYMNPLVNIAQPRLFARQMYIAFRDVLGLTRGENHRAVDEGFAALDRYETAQRRLARETLEKIERENKLGIVVLGRPYHNDPGINHEILVEFQKLGYPVFTQDSLPTDEDILDRLFGEEVRAGEITSPMDITDVWKNAYSENTNRKVWAAKYVARHPNLVALEMSNFKCGHDAPIYSTIEDIVECSGTPYFNFKDLDENKPTGSIKIRVETISYFLARYREEMLERAEQEAGNIEKLSQHQASDFRYQRNGSKFSVSK